MNPRSDRDRASYFDVGYGISSLSITAGTAVVSTTGAAFHGFTINAGSTSKARLLIYDNLSATGNLIDMAIVEADGNAWVDRYIPTMAKNGLTAVLTGTDAMGVLFFGPKG